MSYQVRLFLTLAFVALALLITGLLAVPPILSQTGATVDDTITYQGRLTAADGAPRAGEHTMRFLLYDSATGGASLWDSGEMQVQVNDGLVDVALDVQHGDFDGRARWLEIIVEGETLSPRQAIRPAPYALGLRPGALIDGNTAGDALTVRNWATQSALRAESEDVGLFAVGGNFAVQGVNSGAEQGIGYGGHFSSDTGIGVFGASSAQPSHQNNTAPGVSGYSEHGVGVLGESGSNFGMGVLGQVATGAGVRGDANGYGVLGVSQDHAVAGFNTAPAQGMGYGGYFESSTGAGVYGASTAVPSSTHSTPAGVWGYSENGAAIYGEVGSQFAWAGYFDGHVRMDGTLVVSDSLFADDKSGYVTDVARNDGDEALETGDVVIVTGVSAPVVGDIPVPSVAQAERAYDRAVIGVVARDFDPDDFRAEAGGEIAPGDYLKIVTLGAYAAVKVDAQYREIHPGDLLVSSATPGHAKAVPPDQNPPTGTVIGKALEGWSDGTGVIALLVNMQ